MGLHAAITPVILTYNEAPNLARTLAKLRWAREVVLVDSGSDDETLAIAAGFPNTRAVVHPFATHAEQWNFAVAQTGIESEWILALDADYVLGDALVDELDALAPPADVAAYGASFVYCVDGRPLRGTLYPPVKVLWRRGAGSYVQDGHTQKLRVQGRVERLKNPILHDDRKGLPRWVASQERYARLEARKLLEAGGTTGWPDRIRRLRVVAPFATLAYCLFAKGLILDGWPGIYYSLQRAFAEMLLSLYLVRARLERAVAGRKP